MTLYDAAWELSDLLETNRSVLLRTEPEVPDFTTAASFKIIVWGSRRSVEFDVSPDNLMSIIGMFDSTLFDKDRVDRLYCWNFKSLCSYFHFFVGKHITPGNSVIDLKIIENFLNIRKNRPENLIEAVNRTKVALQTKNWQTVYKHVHLPLALRVLPSIETRPLLNEKTKQQEHPYYEIEGQINGRMNCAKRLTRCYLPHNMGPDVKTVLKPRGYNLRFVYADFRQCEIAVLQWLSKDPVLKGMFESGQDLYSQFYTKITGDECNSEVKRKKAKNMLIAVIYGSGPKGLASMLEVPDDVGKELIRRIRMTLPVASKWLEEQQEKAKQGSATDYFGRVRQFGQEESYLARDFAVQGVAATVCQEKLIELHRTLEDKRSYIVFSVHDGFGLVTGVSDARETYKIVKQVMESESKLCPGLKMKAEIKFGAKLDNMKVLWKD